jgi:hypothetical protein
MSKLFFIGNGFDLAHKIPSGYEDFRLYLISLLNQISGKNYSNYDFSDSEIISIDYKKNLENDILTIMYFLSYVENRTEWRNIEKSVGELNYDDFSWLYIDESKDDKEYRANWINEDLFSPYVTVLSTIPDFFSKWIKQINIDKYHKKYFSSKLSDLFDNDTKFLCFNYTHTLEYLYNIKRDNICYIHGKAKEDDELYFGHGNNLTYEDYIDTINNANYFSVAKGYSEINDILRKPVELIINENSVFFESIKEVDEIYSFGFSYSSVDEPYIREVINKISTNAKWRINSFPPEEVKQDYKDVIRKCGYKGIVEEF